MINLEGYWQNLLSTFIANEGNINVTNNWGHLWVNSPYLFNTSRRILSFWYGRRSKIARLIWKLLYGDISLWLLENLSPETSHKICALKHHLLVKSLLHMFQNHMDSLPSSLGWAWQKLLHTEFYTFKVWYICFEIAIFCCLCLIFELCSLLFDISFSFAMPTKYHYQHSDKITLWLKFENASLLSIKYLMNNLSMQ